MSEKKESDGNNGAGTGLVVEQSKPKLKKPPLYKVLLHNDDYTPYGVRGTPADAVFPADATQSRRNYASRTYPKGVGVCGVFPREIAETKVRLVMDYAMENQHPLQCTMDVA